MCSSSNSSVSLLNTVPEIKDAACNYCYSPCCFLVKLHLIIRRMPMLKSIFVADNQADRVASLDTLRGISCVIVMCWHLTGWWDPSTPKRPYNLPMGYMGVDMFFIISGFVIFMTLERSKTVGQFVFGRFTRLFPTYWLCTLIVFTFTRLVLANTSVFYSVSVESFLLNLTMLIEYWNVSFEWFQEVISAGWTLSYELTFYSYMAFLQFTGWIIYILPIMILNISN